MIGRLKLPQYEVNVTLPIARGFEGVGFDLVETVKWELCWLCVEGITVENDPQHIILTFHKHTKSYRTHIECFMQLGYSMFGFVQMRDIDQIIAQVPQRHN